LMSLLFILAATIVIQFNPTIKWKGEFLAFPKIKMPDWKLSWSELGLDFLKKKKTSVADPLAPVAQTESEIAEALKKENEALQPGFLNRFLEENTEEMEEEELTEEDDIDSLELDPDFEKVTDPKSTSGH